MENERIANEDAMGWQDYNAGMLVAWNRCVEKYNGEQKKRIFWRVNCEILLTKFQLSKAKHMKWKHRSKVKHEKYSKWKLRTRLVRDTNLELEERINFLNERILDLQNNIPQES